MIVSTALTRTMTMSSVKAGGRWFESALVEQQGELQHVIIVAHLNKILALVSLVSSLVSLMYTVLLSAIPDASIIRRARV